MRDRVVHQGAHWDRPLQGQRLCHPRESDQQGRVAQDLAQEGVGSRRPQARAIGHLRQRQASQVRVGLLRQGYRLLQRRARHRQGASRQDQAHAHRLDCFQLNVYKKENKQMCWEFGFKLKILFTRCQFSLSLSMSFSS